MKKDFIFVILHYNENSLKDTFECVKSIEKIGQNKNYQIIIVENGSSDKSQEKLLERYKNKKTIDIVISKINLGFAKGNNLGCKMGIEKYNPKYIIVLNNDTYIKQKNFLEKIELIYKKEKFDLLGPYIFDKNLKPQNPVPNLLLNLNEVEEKLIKANKSLKLLEKSNKLYFFIQKVKKIVSINKKIEKIIRKIIRKKVEKLTSNYANKTIRNIGLHGACLIFSEKYYKKYSNIFYPKTFMYAEEDILYYRVLKNNLVSIYSPDIQVFHKEDSSTDATFINDVEKEKFILKNRIKSLKIYKEILTNEGE